MKTKEELNALKNEAEALNIKLAELTEEELKQVVGGMPCEYVPYTYATPESVIFKFNINDHVELITFEGMFHQYTSGGTVIARKVMPYGDKFMAYYQIYNSDSDYNGKWYGENCFQHGYSELIVHIPL